MENNIDEDIEMAKEVARELRLYVDENKIRKGRAISTVLSELEEKIEQIKVLENDNRILDISLGRELETHKDTNKELETYKKIAEKLAEVIERKFADKYSGIDVNKYKCKQSILGWARKEVENEVCDD